uniref:VWFA domain-containing protein n=1 Tax=Electrophorus electricus TaxID=8005 RepID=A0A4W4FK55_ELEEL
MVVNISALFFPSILSRARSQIFQNHKKSYSVEHNNAQQLVANAAHNIERLLANRSKALEVSALVTAAENLQAEHQWRDDIVVNTGLNRTEFKDDPTFKRLVSYNTTAVHIPTDIYEGSTIILNELNWTAALDEVFQKNKEDDPSLLWQVFGSATGLARYFPASPWMDTSKTPNKIDLYDVRRRPWYIQGAASPKDMLILVDASGSVSGLTLKLIRTSVNEMLETLSDDDFVNVVSFSSDAKPAACFQNLVQANVRNKKILKKAVQSITANGITNYKGGFELAFQQLSVSNVLRANCNKIIMLFTDGGEEKASEIFEKYNHDGKIRIFTFSVGQHNYDKEPIRWMACTNKGYYYEIPSIGAIRINTQEYLDVLGRPMVKEQQKAKKVQWTNVYLDALELGLVITGTMPVFNNTYINTNRNKDSGENQLILGVMAIDVSLDDIKRLTPHFTLGPNGYYFAIDPNGYVLLHPNLQPKNPKFQEPVTLDFLDAELENEIKVQIRKNMIDGEKGNETLPTLVKSQDERYIDRGLRTYTWAPVHATDYSLAIVLPEYSLHYIKARIGDTITQMPVSAVLCDITSLSCFLYRREYCKDLKPRSNNTEFLIEFNEYIDRNTPNNPSCEWTDGCFARLHYSSHITSTQGKDLISAKFVATDGGITRVYPASAGPEWSENPETYESSAYKRSLDNDVYIFTPPLPDNATRTSECVCVCVCVCWVLCVLCVVPGVCPRPPPFSLCPAQNIDCVLLDDGGFLVMANQDHYIDKIGQFFGVIDPNLMTSLLNESLFSFTKTYDYQSVCDPSKEVKAAAGTRSIYVPTIADILNVGWWASAAPDEDISEKESCIFEQTQYFFMNEDRSFKGNLECANCSRQYIAEKLWKTNLVLIIVDAKESCTTCNFTPLIQAEQPSSGPDPCVMAQNPRYRKGPDMCFQDNSGVSRTFFSSLLTLLHTLAVILLPVWMPSLFSCLF